MGWGLEPTPEIASRIPLVIDLILQEIQALRVSTSAKGVRNNGCKPENVSEVIRYSGR
jgi:hypothetical protein